MKRPWSTLRRRDVDRVLRRWRRAIIGGGLALLLAVVELSPLLDLRLARAFENNFLDHRFQWAASTAGVEASGIVMVGVDRSSFDLTGDLGEQPPADEAALEAMAGKPWPWSRAVFARALDKIVEAGARLVVFDFVFKDPLDPAGDAALREALGRHQKKVVIASLIHLEESEKVGLSSRFGAGGDAPPEVAGRNSVQYIEPAEEILPDDDRDLIGYATVWPDGDRVVRRARYAQSLLAMQLPYLRATLPPEMAAQLPDPAEMELDLHSLSLVAAKKIKPFADFPPLERPALINYRGRGDDYPSVPIEDLFLASQWGGSVIDGGRFFEGKVVVVAPFFELQFKDDFATPLGTWKGGQVQAAMIQTLLEEAAIEEVAPGLRLLVGLAALGAAMAVTSIRLNPLFKLLGLGAVVLALEMLAQALFEGFQLHLPVVGPYALALLGGSFVVAYDFLLEQHARSHTRSVLDRQVSRNVAELLVNDAGALEKSMAGQRKEVCILFSDIRGFTHWSEGTTPENLFVQLNEYFEAMVGCIMEEEGTLDKYIGDAVMAVWGDTHSRGPLEDTRSAVASALAMRTALHWLNEKWGHQADRTELAIGVGINRGEAVIGQIGHTERKEFTALGDATNIASRIEGMTKLYGIDILVSESVEALTRQIYPFRYVDRVVMKGKSLPVEVYTPLDPEGGAPDWLDLYNRAQERYRAGDFAGAEQLFRQVEDESARDFTGGFCDPVSTCFRQRCQQLQEHPPAGEWNGVFVSTSK